jgi:hypothetical protein
MFDTSRTIFDRPLNWPLIVLDRGRWRIKPRRRPHLAGRLFSRGSDLPGSSLAHFACFDTAVTLSYVPRRACWGIESVTDIHLINWTIEEAKLLKAERPQSSDVNPIPMLDQILIWPEADSSGRPTKPVDSAAKSRPIQSPSETASVLAPSSEAGAASKRNAGSYSPVVVAVSMDVRTEEPKSTLATVIIRPDVLAVPADLDRMIALRWVLRDIRSNRLKWWPINQHDLRTLIEMGFVEMRDGIPVLTNKGNRAID